MGKLDVLNTLRGTDSGQTAPAIMNRGPMGLPGHPIGVPGQPGMGPTPVPSPVPSPVPVNPNGPMPIPNTMTPNIPPGAGPTAQPLPTNVSMANDRAAYRR
jgi:hypothetical protein